MLLLKRNDMQNRVVYLEYVIFKYVANTLKYFDSKVLKKQWYFNTFKDTSGFVHWSIECCILIYRVTKQKEYYFFQYTYCFHLTGCRLLRNYGENCSLECPHNCLDGYCDIVEGTCLGCKPKFIGPRYRGKEVLYSVIFTIFINSCSGHFFKVNFQHYYFQCSILHWFIFNTSIIYRLYSCKNCISYIISSQLEWFTC